MQKRGPAAMEFLMTYGWAVLISLIAVSGLGYYLTINQNDCPFQFQMSDNIIGIVDQKFAASDSLIPEAQNKFYLLLRNNLPRPAVIQGIILVKKGDTQCGQFEIPLEEIELAPGERTNILQGNLTNPECQGKVGDCYNFDVEVIYSSSTGIEHKATGYIQGHFENVDTVWRLGNWTRTNYAGNVSQDLTGQGKQLGYCSNPVVPAVGSLTTIWDGTSNLAWNNIPPGCSNDGGSIFHHQPTGFAGTCGTTASYLAQGWVHTTIFLDPIFAGSSLFLGSTATYIDNTGGLMTPKTNGICVDDNIYFYVNGQRAYWGGTSGKHDGTDADNILSSGEEILNNCGNCPIVGKTWCIPPFKVTTSNFNFGVDNNIDILVEDFCSGGAMNPLTVTVA
jgi:hypothetical protein